MPSGFHLRKWYFDLVAEDGTTWIGYAGEVGTRAWHFRFSSSFVPHLEPDAKTSLTCAEPSRAGDQLSWTSEPLGCRYSISPDCPSVEKKLYSSDEGSVRWTCAIPSGAATLDVHGLVLLGRGYVELLEMTLPPWDLPLQDLHWGRFSGRGSIVWIRWAGPQPVEIALVNGEDVLPRKIDRDGVALADGSRLSLHDPAVLRDAQIARTLHAIGPIHRLLPHSLMSSHEMKWRSRGVIEKDGAVIDEGWVIHEHVTFAAD